MSFMLSSIVHLFRCLYAELRVNNYGITKNDKHPKLILWTPRQ
ncbi:MAG: hypothetical protein ACI9FU_000453 [Granulosicoccus sp.]